MGRGRNRGHSKTVRLPTSSQWRKQQGEYVVCPWPDLLVPELLGQALQNLRRRPLVSLRATPNCPPLTITASLHLPDAVQGVSDEVWEASVEVHGSQAALKAIPRGHQLGQVAEHILAQATDVQLPCKGSGVNTLPFLSLPPSQDADILPLGPPRHLEGWWYP